MAAEKTIKLLGVAHAPELAAEAVRVAENALEKHARPGQAIAIELEPPADLAAFEKILESKKDFLEAFKPYYMNWARKMIKPDEILRRTQITPRELNTRINKVLSGTYENTARQAIVFYKLFCFAKGKGLEIKPLGSQLISERQQGISTTPKLIDLLKVPVRERLMVSKIIQFKPDFAVVGSGHLEEIKNRLRKNKIKTKTILYMKPLQQLKEAREVRKLRSEYWQRRKQRERLRLGLKRRI